MDVLARAVQRFDVEIYAYCLMGNHYHFVLQTRQRNLSRLMRHVNGVYSQAYNRRHGIVGHLFQGRFKAIHVDRDAYFLEVCRYVELNPVRAGIVAEPSDWRWSSYRAHAGLTVWPAWLGSVSLHAHLLGHEVENAGDTERAQFLYEELVRGGLGDCLWDRALRQEIYLGESAFIERIQARIASRDMTSKDIPAVHLRKPAEEMLRVDETAWREAAMLRAYIVEGQSMSMIAKDWNLSVSRVSRLIKRAEQTGGCDRSNRG